MQVRIAEPSDAEAIARIHCASWRDAYANILDRAFLDGPIEEDRRSLWQKRMDAPSAGQLVFMIEDALGPQGFICIFKDADPEFGSLIDNLHVLPSQRGNGLGHRLFEAGINALLSDGPNTGYHLWVFEENQAALRFYRRLGGQLAGSELSEMAAAAGKTVLRVHWPSTPIDVERA